MAAESGKTFYESFATDKASIETPESIAAMYDRWAPSYDDEIGEQAGKWPAPRLLAAKLAEVMAADGTRDSATVRILDVCAGTGRLTKELRRLGIANAKVDGHDGSGEMLRVAQTNGIYDNVYEALLYGDKDTNELPANSYDYVIAVGCFNKGGLDRECVRHLYNAAKPNGKILFAVTMTYYDGRFDAVIERYAAEGKVKVLEKILMPEYIKMMESEDQRGMMHVLLKIK